MKQEGVNLVNIYAPIIEATKYRRKILKDLKKNINSNIIITGDFNTPLSLMVDLPNKESSRGPGWCGSVD